MTFTELMRRLGHELCLDDFQPDAQGAYAIQRAGLKISFYADPDECFTAICPLGHIDIDDVQGLEALLQGNLFADGVGGSAIGIDAEGAAYLTQSFNATELGYAEFLAALERFVGTAAHWCYLLANGQLATA